VALGPLPQAGRADGRPKGRPSSRSVPARRP